MAQEYTKSCLEWQSSTSDGQSASQKPSTVIIGFELDSMIKPESSVPGRYLKILILPGSELPEVYAKLAYTVNTIGYLGSSYGYVS